MMALRNFQLHLTWIALAYIMCAHLSKAKSTEEPGSRKCERAYPSFFESITWNCTYLCKGSPVRLENEPDGKRCGLFGIIFNTQVCQAGKCVYGDEVIIPPNDRNASSATGKADRWLTTVLPLLEKSTITSLAPTSEHIVTKAQINVTNATAENAMENTKLHMTDNPNWESSTHRSVTVNTKVKNATRKIGTKDARRVYRRDHATTEPAMIENTRENKTENITEKEVTSEQYIVTATLCTTDHPKTQQPSEETTTANQRTTSDSHDFTEDIADREPTTVVTESDVSPTQSSEKSPLESQTVMASHNTPSGSLSNLITGCVNTVMSLCFLVLCVTCNIAL